jgi:hypothetical protein
MSLISLCSVVTFLLELSYVMKTTFSSSLFFLFSFILLAKDGGVSQEHFSTGLVLANPLDGKGLKNSKEIVGKAVLLERGKITFVEKVRVISCIRCDNHSFTL